MTPEAIRALRISMNLSQVQMSEYFNVNFRTIGNWEAGITQPSPLQDAVLRKLNERVMQIPDPVERINFADKILATVLGAGGILLALNYIFSESRGSSDE
jgi:transcriptional regulator with XRE-family HTH domain